MVTKCDLDILQIFIERLFELMLKNDKMLILITSMREINQI
jgi:hypothetical protein